MRVQGISNAEKYRQTYYRTMRRKCAVFNTDNEICDNNEGYQGDEETCECNTGYQGDGNVCDNTVGPCDQSLGCRESFICSCRRGGFIRVVLVV